MITQPTLSRRRVLTGLIAAPMIVRTPGLLMPARSVPSPILELLRADILASIGIIFGLEVRFFAETDDAFRNRLLRQLNAQHFQA